MRGVRWAVLGVQVPFWGGGTGMGLGRGHRDGFGVRIQGFTCPPLHRESQVELREHIDSLATGEPKLGGHPCPPLSMREQGGLTQTPSPELCRINEDQKVALDLDPYVKKLLNARRRVVLVNNILQNAQVRGDGDLGGSQSPPRCSQVNFGHSRSG